MLVRPPALVIKAFLRSPRVVFIPLIVIGVEGLLSVPTTTLELEDGCGVKFDVTLIGAPYAFVVDVPKISLALDEPELGYGRL